MVFQIGKTKIFLKAGQMAELDAQRAGMLGISAKVIQKQIRTHITHKKFVSMRKASIHIQSFWRGESIKCPFIGNVPLFSECVLYTPGHYHLMHVPFH
jgi:myosin heavy subunit